jgi:general secretion pathway protein H
MNQRRQRGFTLVEMSAVIIVLALMAAAITPRLAATIEANKVREYRRNVINLFGQARENAVRTGQTTSVSHNEGEFRMQSGTEDSANVMERVESIETVRAENFEVAGSPSGDGDWQVSFYPDGTCDGGGFELSEGGSTESIRILKRTGQIYRNDGDLAATEDPEARWNAGENVPSG